MIKIVCSSCEVTVEIDPEGPAPYICPNCKSEHYFLFSTKMTIGDLVDAVRASGQTFMMMVYKTPEGILLSLHTEKMGTYEYLLDEDNFAIAHRKSK